MRRPAPSILPILILPLVLPACAAGRAAPTVREVRLDLPAGSRAPFEVHNLAGKVEVVPGLTDHVEVVATVTAASLELASSIRLERTMGGGGTTLVKVVYPLDEYPDILYPRESDMGSEWLNLIAGGGTTRSTYDGRRVKVSTRDGTLLYADIEVRIPRGGPAGSIENMVGDVSASDTDGILALKAVSGDVSIEGSRGKISAVASSGDVRASGIEGEFTGRTSSGDVRIEGFDGTSLQCATASGDIEGNRLHAERIDASTASGDVRLDGPEAASVTAKTASGDVSVRAGGVEHAVLSTASGDVKLFASGTRLKTVEVGTAGGDIDLGMDPDASFDLRLDGGRTGGARLDMRYPGAEKILEGGKLVGFRRAGARTKIRIHSGHGSILVHPESARGSAAGG